ncbi:MG2 domain-containing protein, partial [Oligoflexaceae bacterium]|nr:MG2 domain-containing protein [Oligoflexaceae bacterium]
SLKTDVEIRAFSRSNRVIGKCKTKASDGGCTIDDVFKEDMSAQVVVAKSGEDLSYLSFQDVAIDDEKIQEQGKNTFDPGVAGMDVFAYSSRGVYRPGEAIEFSALIRDKNFKSVAGKAFKVSFKSPRDKVIEERVVKTTNAGFLSRTFSTDPSYETGQYSVVVEIGKKVLTRYSVQVEEFVPERIDLQVSSKKKSYIAEQKADVLVDAQYLFGTPVKGGKFTLNCQFEPAFRKVPGNSSYLTGELAKENENRSISLDKIEGNLGPDGKSNQSCDYSSIVSEMKEPMNLRAIASVSEAGSGRATVKSNTILVSPSRRILGLDINYNKDSSIGFRVQSFDVEGKKAKVNSKLKVTLLRQEYNWLYSYDPYYGYERWHSEYYFIPEVSGEELVLKDGFAELKLKTDSSWGRYQLRIEDPSTGAVAEDAVYLGYYWYDEVDDGGEFKTTKPRSPDEMPVVVSKKEVIAGESFEASISAPFEGRGLICAETNLINSCQWVDIKAGDNKVALTAPDVRPNFYVTALVFKNPSEGKDYIPARSWGATSVAIAPEKQKLSLKVSVPKKIRPNNKLAIDIDGGSEGAKAEYSVALVDEGILQLTQFQSPDPVKFFHRKRSLGVKSFETLGWTFFKQASPGGGAGGSSTAEAKAPVRIVSFWKTGIKADASGKARVIFEIPPFQGKLRAMVVAASPDRYGSAMSHSIIADPVVILPTLPRFLSQNDRINGKLMVTNTTAKPKVITVDLKTNLKLPKDQLTQKFTLKPKDSKVIVYPLSVDLFSGEGTFEFTASYDGTTSKDSLTLPVIPSTNQVNKLIDLAMNKPSKLQQLIPKNLRTDLFQLKVNYSPAPVGGVVGKIESLIGYPYGCIEQTTSKTFPLLVMKDIIENLKLEEFKDKPIDKMVQAGIQRVSSMQVYDGGFSYWPGGAQSVQWGSAYATHMLLTAKEQGYSVSKNVLDAAIDYLNNMMSSSYSYRRQQESEPYMAFVLGLAKKHQRGYLRQISQIEPARYENLEQDFLVMGAMKLAQEDRLLTRFVAKKTLYKLASLSNQRRGGSYYSSRRSRALRLAISESIWPGDIKAQSLARKVVSDIKESYWTTQELAWSLLGLVKRQNKLGWPTIKDKPMLQLGSKKLAPQSGGKFSYHWSVSQPPLSSDVSMAGVSGSNNLATLTFSGYEKTFTKPKTSGNLKVKRVYYDVKGRKVDMKTVKAGQLVVVEVEVANSGEKVENAAVVDRIPAGFEVENPRLGRSNQFAWMGELNYADWYIDVRDNEVRFFGTLDSGARAKKNLFYVARATSSGDFIIPPAKVEDMYDPENANFSPVSRVRIQD